jgi:predicted homoserine dehydrogenase-like protein
MIIIDTALKARAQAGKPVVFGMYGAGFMAKGIANQMQYMQGIRIGAICNRTVAKGVEMLTGTGHTDVEVVTTVAQLDTVIARGGVGVTDNAELIAASTLIECLVEATGHVEYGARATLAAIEHKKHMVLMNAELDGTVGPILKTKADAAGVILTGSDGDQPAVEINLVRFVESIGLTPRVCGNIKGLQDRYRNPTTQESFAKQWGQTPSMVTSFADGTKISFEQAIVANATGMKVAQRGMIGIEHKGHVDELTGSYDLDMLREHGGIVEYVVGSVPSPGVYVFAEAHDTTQAHYLNYGKLGTGPLYSFYVPYHLTIFEVPLSVARVVLFGDTPIAPLNGPVVEVITAAKVSIDTGTTLDGLGEYLTYGMCENADVARRENLLPMGLAEGCVLKRGVEKDAFITFDDVELPTDTVTHQLWFEQEKYFGQSRS